MDDRVPMNSARHRDPRTMEIRMQRVFMSNPKNGPAENGEPIYLLASGVITINFKRLIASALNFGSVRKRGTWPFFAAA